MTTFILKRDEVRELVPHLEYVAWYAGECALEEDSEHLGQFDRLIDMMHAFLDNERVEA